MSPMHAPAWLRRLLRREPADPLARELEDWRIVSAVNTEEGQGAVFRLRIRRPRLENPDAFAFAAHVTWPYGPPIMPTPDIAKLQREFDVALDELTGFNGFSELVRVATGNGMKEWLFYTTDVVRFGMEFNRLLEGHPQYPVTLQFEEDPHWRIWSAFVEAVEGRT